MIEIIWEYIVKEEALGQFELAYGPGGAWSGLFSRSPGFRGLTLLRDAERPCRFLSVDVWDSIEHRERALAEHGADYAKLDSSFAKWTDSETELGVFVVRGGAGVRPLGRR